MTNEPTQLEALVRSWHEATARINPSPDFAERVVRGSRARGRRARVRTLTWTCAVLAFAATAVLTAPVRFGTVGSTDPRLTEPTRGDLATDRRFLADAVDAWQAGIRISPNEDRGIFDDPRGGAHVYWAGHTPSGRAAVILQPFYLHPHGNLGSDEFDTMQTLIGVVSDDPSTDGPTLVGDDYHAEGSPAPGQFRFGPGDRTVLVMPHELPLYLSTRPNYRTDGRVTRAWEPLPFRDGVALIQVPDGDDPDLLRLVASPIEPDPAMKDEAAVLHLRLASLYRQFAEANRTGATIGLEPAISRLPWNTVVAGPARVGRDTDLSPPMGSFAEYLGSWGAIDVGNNDMAYGTWSIVAGLADGTTAIVSEIATSDQPSRLYAVILGADAAVQRVHPGGTIDIRATLPVRIRLPDGQGWVVADYGYGLAYRTGAATQWVDAGRDAALLPDSTLQVRVDRLDGPRIIDLGQR